MRTPDLTREIRGVPLWAWLVAGSAALYIVYRMRKKQTAKDAENETVAQEGDYFGEGGGYIPVGNTTGSNALPEITGEDLEGVAAQIESIGAGLQDALTGIGAGIQDQIGGLTDAVEDIEWPDYPDMPEQPADPENPTGEPPGGGPGSKNPCPIGYESDGKGNCIKKKQAGGGHKCPKGHTWDPSRGGCVPIKLPVGIKVPVVPPRNGKDKDDGKKNKGPVQVTDVNGKGSLTTVHSQPDPVKSTGGSVTGGGTVAPPPIRVQVTDIVTSKPEAERKPAVYEPPVTARPPVHKPAVPNTFAKVLPGRTGNPKGK